MVSGASNQSALAVAVFLPGSQGTQVSRQPGIQAPGPAYSSPLQPLQSFILLLFFFSSSLFLPLPLRVFWSSSFFHLVFRFSPLPRPLLRLSRLLYLSTGSLHPLFLPLSLSPDWQTLVVPLRILFVLLCCPPLTFHTLSLFFLSHLSPFFGFCDCCCGGGGDPIAGTTSLYFVLKQHRSSHNALAKCRGNLPKVCSVGLALPLSFLVLVLICLISLTNRIKGNPPCSFDPDLYSVFLDIDHQGRTQ